jgi:hypothetical protein
LWSNEELQNIANKVSLKDDADGKNKTLWELIKEVLAEIIEFFSFGTERLTPEKELDKIKYMMTANRRVIVKNEAGRFVGDDVITEELPPSIKNMEAYSALHAGLKELMNIQRTTVDEGQFEVFNQKVDTYGKALESDMYISNSTPALDSLYKGIKSYSSSWTDELKQLYHKATTDGSIIC